MSLPEAINWRLHLTNFVNMSPSSLKSVLESPSSDKSVSEAHIATAILHVIETARSQGQSLDDVMTELMTDDALLDPKSRHLLGDILTQAWNTL
mgnify:FL=1